MFQKMYQLHYATIIDSRSERNKYKVQGNKYLEAYKIPSVGSLLHFYELSRLSILPEDLLENNVWS